MYIFQKIYKGYENILDKQVCSVVVILPAVSDHKIKKFLEIVENTVKERNRELGKTKWELTKLYQKQRNRSPENNYTVICNADIIIAECTDKKPNIFYLIGLAHACGQPVCSCYLKRQGQTSDIPFNVHGRQNMIYSLRTMEEQEKFRKELLYWMEKYE